MTFPSSHDGLTCYICGMNFAPHYMLEHIAKDHTSYEAQFFLAIHYVDDWKELNELAIEVRE